MDPASIVGIVASAASLAKLALETATYLVGLKDSFNQMELHLLDLASRCQTLDIAWRRVHVWASASASNGAEEGMIFDQLRISYEASNIILNAINADIKKVATAGKSSWRLSPKSKTRVLLHEKSLAAHGERVNAQINSLNLLLSTAQL